MLYKASANAKSWKITSCPPIHSAYRHSNTLRSSVSLRMANAPKKMCFINTDVLWVVYSRTPKVVEYANALVCCALFVRIIRINFNLIFDKGLSDITAVPVEPALHITSMASIAAAQPSRHARRVHLRSAIPHGISHPRLHTCRMVQTGRSSSQLSSHTLTPACHLSVGFP
jgi:hypothetical protein